MPEYYLKTLNLNELHTQLKLSLGDNFIGISNPPLRILTLKPLTETNISDIQEITNKIKEIIIKVNVKEDKQI